MWVCGTDLQRKGLLSGHYKAVSCGKFTKEGAQEHTRYIGGNVLKGIDLAEETARRLKIYETDGTIISERPISYQSHEICQVVWEQEAEEAFKSVVPKAFQGLVKTGVEN